jgi:hypothetical protein
MFTDLSIDQNTFKNISEQMFVHLKNATHQYFTDLFRVPHSIFIGPRRKDPDYDHREMKVNHYVDVAPTEIRKLFYFFTNV